MNAMELTAKIHEEDGSYWAEVAELPGCFASGATIGELLDALKEAIGLYLDGGPKVVAHVASVGLEVDRLQAA